MREIQLKCNNCGKKRDVTHMIEGLCHSCYVETGVDDSKTRLDGLDDMYDVVDRPKHYNQGNIEVLDFILDQNMSYLQGNVVKYICRYKFKNGLEDLKKAQFYLNELIEEYEQETTVSE